MPDVPSLAPVQEFAPPLRLGADVYRRRIVLTRLDPQRVRADLEDDFHHFVVTLHHDGDTVRDVVTESHRWPWSTCPSGGEVLRRLIGMPLAERFTAAGGFTDPARNCTHQFDAAALAITHAARGIEARQYDAEISAHFGQADQSAPSTNRLWIDGALALEWNVLPGRGITGPVAPFDTAPWKGGFMRWADDTLPPEPAEAAIVLRRACDIGLGRGMDLDAIPVASDLLGTMQGVCHSMQPEIAPSGLRNVGSIRDFSSRPESLCTDPPGA